VNAASSEMRSGLNFTVAADFLFADGQRPAPPALPTLIYQAKPRHKIQVLAPAFRALEFVMLFHFFALFFTLLLFFLRFLLGDGFSMRRGLTWPNSKADLHFLQRGWPFRICMSSKSSLPCLGQKHFANKFNPPLKDSIEYIICSFTNKCNPRIF
jgi:hypothetical protein